MTFLLFDSKSPILIFNIFLYLDINKKYIINSQLWKFFFSFMNLLKWAHSTKIRSFIGSKSKLKNQSHNIIIKCFNLNRYEELSIQFDEFQKSSRDFEQELESELKQCENEIKELNNRNHRLTVNNDLMKVILI